MAIAYDAQSSDTRFNSFGTNSTWSHTCAGSDRVLLVGFGIYRASGDSDIVTGVTYNGAAMTKLGITVDAQSNTATYLFALANPATGANNIVVSYSASTNYAWGVATSYTGVDQTTPTGSLEQKTYTTLTSLTDNISITPSDSWIAGLGFINSATRYSSITSPYELRAENGTDPRSRMFDSAGVVSSGSNTITISLSNGTNSTTHWVELKAAGGATPTVYNALAMCNF